MYYSIAADIVVVIHFLWILFLVVGAFPGRRYRRVKIFHIAGLLCALVIQAAGWYCPLTYLEIWLREKGAVWSYEGPFIIHYIDMIVYPDITPGMILVLTLLLAAASVIVYLYRPRK